MQGEALCFHWCRRAGYGFLFSAHNISVKINILGVMEYLIHCHSILYAIAFDQGIYFKTNEVWQGTPAHGIHWHYHVS